MSNIPQYKKLHRQLKQEILEGVHKEGELIPSENQLSREFGINRMTVRKALDALVNEGLIAKKAGKGSVVLSNRLSLGLLSFKGFSEVVEPTEHSAQTIFLSPPHVTEWTQPFFFELTDRQLNNGCIQLERLRMVDNDPVMLEQTWIENDGLKDLAASPLVAHSLFKTLHFNYGIEVVNLEQDIRAIAAPTVAAQHLKMDVGHPLIHIYRKYITSKNAFFIYSSLYCNTEKYALGNKF
jgi:GntR family transcriptional regulator/GntR family frlABCD operon transcriptional regulator